MALVVRNFSATRVTTRLESEERRRFCFFYRLEVGYLPATHALTQFLCETIVAANYYLLFPS